jgi:hypothetical protein
MRPLWGTILHRELTGRKNGPRGSSPCTPLSDAVTEIGWQRRIAASARFARCAVTCRTGRQNRKWHEVWRWATVLGAAFIDRRQGEESRKRRGVGGGQWCSINSPIT